MVGSFKSLSSKNTDQDLKLAAVGVYDSIANSLFVLKFLSI
jgi:hypothetical protein